MQVFPEDIPDFSSHLADLGSYLQAIRQNWLLGEGALITFAKERDINVWGVGNGDPGEFHARGWLTSDGFDAHGGLSFHPFRIYPLHKIVSYGRLGIAASSVIRNDRVQEILEHCLSRLPSFEQIGKVAQSLNRITDLAIMLEPIYWPQITGVRSWNDGFFIETTNDADPEITFDSYKEKIVAIVRDLNPIVWQAVHERLRIDAGKIDRNDELYLLLRLSNWDQRKKLLGRIGASLWIRHIAEVIRRAFEEVHSVQWFEEDRTFGTWYPGGRKFAFGSERPLDDEDASRPYLAWGFDLITGSVLRWYVEGKTEFGAITQAIPDAAKANIELVNLHGNIASERDNTAMKLGEWLREDKAQRRFSMISFDMDVPANIKAIRRQIEQDNVIGYISANRPDFEFANFSVRELAEVAAQLDEEVGISGDPVRNYQWESISNGREFEAKYKQVSARHPSGLKGEDWGRALAKYVETYPIREDTGIERPFFNEIGIALGARIGNYDFQKAAMSFDAQTFELIDRGADAEGVERIDSQP